VVQWAEKSISERVFASGKGMDCGSGQTTTPSGDGSPDCAEDPENNQDVDLGSGQTVSVGLNFGV